MDHSPVRLLVRTAVKALGVGHAACSTECIFVQHYTATRICVQLGWHQPVSGQNVFPLHV